MLWRECWRALPDSRYMRLTTRYRRPTVPAESTGVPRFCGLNQDTAGASATERVDTHRGASVASLRPNCRDATRERRHRRD